MLWQECINDLRKLNLEKYSFENNDVFRVCHELRMFWKPENVKLILLAESHVYMTDDEIKIKQDLSPFFKDYLSLKNYPTEYVRLIYCLGYGESTLLNKIPEKFNNRGTAQFWKIFYYCLNNFNPKIRPNILRTKNKEENQRNKIKLLLEMKEKGIWLLDASLIGLYDPTNKHKVSDNEYNRILYTCWDKYIKGLIEESNPNGVIVIGQR